MLDTIAKQHPEYEITVLLRNVPENFSSLYPKVHVVKGDYDSTDIITDAASKVNVVVRKWHQINLGENLLMHIYRQRRL